MVVRVQLFGPEASLLCADSIDVQLDREPTCENLLRELQRLHPQLSGRIAVNHAFAKPAQRVQPHDEVALIGLVSGG